MWIIIQNKFGLTHSDLTQKIAEEMNILKKEEASMQLKLVDE